MVYNGSERHKENLEKARQAAQARIECRYCSKLFTLGNILRHENSCLKNDDYLKTIERICLYCKNPFYKKDKGIVTCSRACSNKQFRTKYMDIYIRRRRDKASSGKKRKNCSGYRNICFKSHKHECVVCGENLVIDVHHFNENCLDNSPENLIPLCPTHHRYMHTKHKNLIINKIDKYINEYLLLA